MVLTLRVQPRSSSYRAYLPRIHREEQPGKHEQPAPEGVARKVPKLQTPEALALDGLPCESKGRPCSLTNGIMDMGVLEQVPIDPAAAAQNMSDQFTSWRP